MNMRLLKTFIENGSVSEVLRKKSAQKDAVRELQESLKELGFGKELNWEQFGADGDFGNSTAEAIKAFARKNGLTSAGDTVTRELAEALVKRLEIVGPLRILFQLAEKKRIEEALFRGSNNRTEIIALQQMLNHLGFDIKADGDYGTNTAIAVKTFAQQEGFTLDGEKMGADLAKRILEKFVPFFGEGWAEMPKAQTDNSSIPSVLKKFRLGVYTGGKLKPAAFIENNPELLKSVGLTDSTARLLAAVSLNEGNLEAVNTWDNSYLTFGMFQWTIGQGSDVGELPAMVNKIKRKSEDVFQECFGKYGLDISIAHTNDVYGYFKLNDDLVKPTSHKEKLRADIWAARFYEAGHHPTVQAIQIQHAADRLLTFYWKSISKNSPYLLSDLVTSEYGVALLLDNHVNRPGYVMTCVERALTQTGLKDPETWTTEEERKLLLAYLDIRKVYGKYPMTDAADRGARIRDLVKNGKLSEERHSFTFQEIASRGLFDTPPRVPAGYDPNAYPDIKWREDDVKDKAL